jgi:sugar lactone lactonase YvrE
VKSIRAKCLVAVANLALGLTLLPAAHAQNVISTVVGGGATPSAPLSADIPGPTSAVRDAALNTYIAAPYSAIVFELSTAGTLSNYAGLGYGGFNDGVALSASLLGSPAAIAIDGKGNIFIADYGSSRVREVVAGSGMITTVAGNGTKCDIGTNACGDGGPATSAQLNLPEAVAVDGVGNVYIADAVDNKIRVVNMQTSAITIAGVSIPVGDIATVAGSGATCANPTNTCGDGAAATAAQLNFPEGVAVDGAGNIYVSDTADQRVRIVSSAGTINPFAGNGGFCRNPLTSCGDGHPATLGNLHRPQLVALDSSGDLYIADTQDNKIRMVDTTGIMNLIAGTGAQGFGGDAGSATAAILDFPVGVSVDSANNVLISDSGNQRVRIVTAGTITTLAGGGSGGDGAAATSATLAGPYNVAEDSTGNLYIADTGNNRIRKISNGTVTTVAGTGSLGYSGDGASALSATLNGPTSVAVDRSGNLFIADYGNLVVREVTASTGFISTVAGNGNPCSPTTSACGDGGPATSANLTSPLTVAVDGSDDIYIADYYAFKIREVAGSTQLISTFAGVGKSGYNGNGGPANKAGLNHPSSIALDGLGNVYIADQWNFRIREVNAKGIISLYALDGKTCLCGDGGPALQGSYWDPLEVAVDPSNNVYIGGGNANVVQRVDSITYTWGTVAGQAADALVGGFGGDGGLATNATLANYGLLVDGQSNLYIADGGNNRIRLVHLTPAATFPTQPLNFGNTPLNTTTAAKTATLTSSGGVDLNVTGISIGGTSPSNFAQTNTCGTLPTNLGVDSVCKVSVTFTPTAYGQATATLTVTDNGPTSPQTINLAGSGPDFTIADTPTKITIAPGANGSVSLKLTPIADFNQTIALSCTGAPKGTTCTVNPTSVTLNGTTAGSATVTITVGSSTAPGTYTLTARGTFIPLSHPASITLVVP